MRYHYTLTRMAKIKIGSTTKAGEDAENLDHGYCAGGYVQWFGHSAKLFGSLLQNEICIYHVTQQLHSMVTYSKETEIHGNTKFCTQMLIAVLSVIAPS